MFYVMILSCILLMGHEYALTFPVFTSRLLSLVVSNRVSVFSFMVFMFLHNKLT